MGTDELKHLTSIDEQWVRLAEAETLLRELCEREDTSPGWCAWCASDLTPDGRGHEVECLLVRMQRWLEAKDG